MTCIKDTVDCISGAKGVKGARGVKGNKGQQGLMSAAALTGSVEEGQQTTIVRQMDSAHSFWSHQ